MSMQDICRHERANMHIRKLYGYGQYDDHVWAWLNFWITTNVDASWARIMGRLH